MEDCDVIKDLFGLSDKDQKPNESIICNLTLRPCDHHSDEKHCGKNTSGLYSCPHILDTRSH